MTVSRRPPEPRWPAVRREIRPWRTNPNQHGPQGNRPNREDRLLTEISVEIPGAIARAELKLDAETRAACDEAAVEITRLESRAEHLAGVGELLVRTEAVASSKIEHIYADVDDIARASIGAATGASAQRTVAAAQALGHLSASCDGGRALSHEAILEAHRRLLHGDLLEGATAGRYRQQQNWIGGSDFTPRTAVHVPPPYDEVVALMSDLITFAGRDDVSVIAQAAAVHGQFEAIHPFTDGNGRIGRSLIGACWRRRGLTERSTVPVAAAMLSDVDRYFACLAAYRDGDPEPLVEHVAHSAITAAASARISADRLAGLPEEWHAAVGARRASSAHTLIEGLTANPVLDIAVAQTVTGSTRVRTYEALDRLTDRGVLDEITGASRNRVWVAVAVLEELGDLEERIGRRAAPSTRWRSADR